MNIVHIAAEFAPLAKVGGLGDVLLGLCRATSEQGEKVEVILPKYACLSLDLLKNLKMTGELKGKSGKTRVWQGFFDQVLITLLEDPRGYFNRDKIYGHADDADRFLFFSKKALEYLEQRSPPDIIQVHDWHTAPIALMAKETFPIASKVVLTIHNLSYQGVVPKPLLAKFGIDVQKLSPQIADDVTPSDLNCLKAGIVFADAITTVSPNYAREILTPLGGGSLYPTLMRYRDKLTGILNGIDYKYWDPSSDAYLPFHYSVNDIRTEKPFIEAKQKIRAQLSQRFGLELENTPLVASITRLVSQKGPLLIKQALYHTLERGGQFILLGSSTDPELSTLFATLKKKFTGCQHVHLELSYEESLSHLLYAAADIVLIPSLFEPCGLAQMIAMRYGALPVVRETGGLVDTVKDGVNGFSFYHPTNEGIVWALDRAIMTYEKDPARFKMMIQQGMEKDFSWNHPAEEYMKLYRKLTANQEVKV